MSELYKKYISLKSQNFNKYFLFKNGFFYIFLDKDAKIMSNILGLKLGNLNSKIVKCGFPETSLEKYLEDLKNLNYEVCIVPTTNTNKPATANEYLSFLSLKKLASKISKIDVDNLSISQAFELLADLKKESNIILKEETNGD